MDISEIDYLAARHSQMSIWNAIQQVLRNESGATAIEYGLIAALISVTIIAALQLTGTNLSNTFTTVANSL